MRWILVIALAASPAYADMYKCQAGGKTVYQGTPCPNAKVVNNVNGKAPPFEDQINAMYRAASDRAKATPDTRQSNSQRQKIERPGTITAAPAGAVAGKSSSPDRYYDRPDRYYDRPDRNKNRTASQSVKRGQNEDEVGVSAKQRAARGAINSVTGEFYAPAGEGYVNTRNGTYYAPAGPNGVIDTRTGQFIPMH